MRIDIVTIFPDLFGPFLELGLIGRARRDGLLEVAAHDLRDHAEDARRSVDDEPYGGGGGMVLMAPPLLRAIRSLRRPASRVALLSPQGRPLSDAVAQELATREHLVLVCGRYEGVDERVRQLEVDEELSIGDYVLSGGEVAAMVVVEAISRQIPGVVGLADSVINDSFRSGLLDHPHYTRPLEVDGLEVPEVLRSGNHAAIAAWRREQAEEATRRKRPDLLEPRSAGPETSEVEPSGLERSGRSEDN
ncbi:MAG: tRNA (guanosine(37)-N1)-methyltransferase TrmD [Acidobacteria bacterium]|nr:MAG: tRNA (guanosine(37)-N1)-methyltransferase TrmD [Acidobacteriota bacterium]REK11617.1 MAG: tRNA (guanosine(37)-N1)-methyltransferase TrmD [Acidobacteriota bacterium]